MHWGSFFLKAAAEDLNDCIISEETRLTEDFFGAEAFCWHHVHGSCARKYTRIMIR